MLTVRLYGDEGRFARRRRGQEPVEERLEVLAPSGVAGLSPAKAGAARSVAPANSAAGAARRRWTIAIMMKTCLNSKGRRQSISIPA